MEGLKPVLDYLNIVMTTPKPTLVLRRLVILKAGASLYDEVFHVGLNIIRGENSSGKSTIADFIFFVLGGHLQSWTPEAAGADWVHAEVDIRGDLYTLSREVDPGSRPAMHLVQGSFDEAMAARGSWLRYPYARSGMTESFSQVLFALLGFPEQKTEAQQNITMHQILRLLYVDQITPVDVIFREERFDNRDIRTAIGELLLGIDDLAMHDIRLQLRAAERAFDRVAGELRSLFRVLGQSDHSDISIVDYEAEIESAEREQARVRKAVDDLRSNQQDDVVRSLDEETGATYQALRAIKGKVAESRRREQSVAFDLEDSRQFIDTLKGRLAALSASKDMAAILGDVHFTTCPACLQVVSRASNSSVCHLCKAAISRSEPWGGYLKMRDELTFQLRESQRLIETRETELASIRTSLMELARQQKTAEARLVSLQRSLHAVDAEIDSHLQNIGYHDRLIEDLNRRAELARVIHQRTRRRDALNEEMTAMKDLLEIHKAEREARTEQVKARLSDLAVDPLRRDLAHEESFQNAQAVEFDFAANRIAVDGRERFSASSTTLLKNAFVTSLVRLSAEDDQLRWPRFALLDNIEDKGMQPERSASYQEFMADWLDDIQVDVQVILATSMISPNLEGSPYCVGPYYTREEKTLSYHTAHG